MKQRLIELHYLIKYLGILIDEKLTFKDHIEHLAKKLNSSLFILRVLSKFCDTHLLLIVYHAIFISHINYGISVWSNCSKNLKNKLFVLQKKAIRLIFQLKRNESCKPIFIKHQLLTIPSLIKLNCIKQYVNCLNDTNSKQHDYNTRQKTNNELISTSEYLRRGRIHFNDLPSEVKKEYFQERKISTIEKYLKKTALYNDVSV